MNGAGSSSDPLRGLDLVELNAHVLGTHSTLSLVLLSREAAELGVAMTASSIKGFFPKTRASITAEGASIVSKPRRSDLRVRSFAFASRFSDRAYNGLTRLSRGPGVRYQFLLLSRALAEAASLRMAKRSHASQSEVSATVSVVLTASEGLPATAAALSGVAHVRVVHEADHFEGRVLRLCEALSRRRNVPAVAVCTTEALASRLREKHPQLSTTVRPFALFDAEMRVGSEERSAARASLGLAQDEVVAALVGGWWPYKDIACVEAALASLTRPVVLLIVGGPTDDTVVERMKRGSRGRVVVFGKQVSNADLRSVYAACDFSLVSRVPGTAKESGLVMDAARYGVPLVLSDHDPALVRLLEGQGWVRFFRAGDAASLAQTLDRAAIDPLGRPDDGAAALLGMMTARQAIELFEELGDVLEGKELKEGSARSVRNRAGT